MTQSQEYEALVRSVSDVMRAQVAQPVSWDERARAVLAEIAKAAQEWPTAEMTVAFMKTGGMPSAKWCAMLRASPLVKGQDE